ncbi:MAG TPA: hypothetical protein VK177_12180 [Flavobacteriales bacterium]|nr:hypothetical protein [Flavobacteriales bacterium]
MKYTFGLLFACILFGCSSSTNQETKEKPVTVHKDTLPETAHTAEQEPGKVISTYDDTAFTNQVAEHRGKLKNLHTQNVFKQIHDAQLSKLEKKHVDFFNENKQFEILAYAKGLVLGKGRVDAVFAVYDIAFERLTFIVHKWAGETDSYVELYRGLPVINGLKESDCNYFAFGTLDYQLAEEIIMQTDPLINKPLAYLEFTAIKITDVEKDETFITDKGCFSHAFKKEQNAICISTSMTYNNWECLQYNPAKDECVIVYGQAFAD